MSDKRKNRRTIEIVTGFFFLFTILTILLAYMINFDYNLPHITIKDNFDYLSDSASRQKLSASFWIIAGTFCLFLLPLYLILFYRFQKGMHIFNGLLLLCMAWAFMQVGVIQLTISKVAISTILDNSSSQTANTLGIMRNMKAIQTLIKFGLTALGGFATVLSISRFKQSKFPTLGSLLTFLSGPVVIAFTWINQDHILLTCGIAGLSIGLITIGAWLVNRGLVGKNN